MSGLPQSATACGWCGEAFKPGSVRLDRRIVCARCGAATTSPIPTERELERAYASWYRPEGGRFAGPGDRLLARTRGLLAGRIDARAPAGPVLDVGSGDGALLAALREHGREAAGLEREAGEDPDVLTGDLRDLDQSWSAIVFWHSLEHLREPGETVAVAARMLQPGGMLVIAAPNSDSLQARVFGDRWLALDLPRHLIHLPAPALQRRLADLGLRVGRVSHARGGQIVFGWLHGLVGSLPGRPNLYDAIRRPEARSRPISPGRRAMTIVAGVVLAPIAALAALLEIAARRGGSVYVEAHRG